jgi:hypothetical protein
MYGWQNKRRSNLNQGIPSALAGFQELGVAGKFALGEEGFRTKLDRWDKFGTSPRQAINHGVMNYLGRVGSDTGVSGRIFKNAARKRETVLFQSSKKETGLEVNSGLGQKLSISTSCAISVKVGYLSLAVYSGRSPCLLSD